ncbi:MAG: ABC transporter permease subunit, partial [Thermoplasmata archaeon]|nr:ABC transporter permease subunit [Thermoplasmata archaeon]
RRWITPGTVPLVAIPVMLGVAAPHLTQVGGYLPVAAFDLGASFSRMLIAYLLSLGFALTYGYIAATHRTSERIMIPVLDLLQSVPILGFFPVAIVVFVSLTPHSWIGPNIASIFLIFTSMSWNMVFGVYESVKSVPVDLKEAAASFGVTGRQRLRQVLLPATVNRLVYNSILSWTGGWYFLVAAEFISNSSSQTVLPGIGSFLIESVNNGPALIAGLSLLIVLIAALDLAVWRPLGRYAERFRYDQVPSGEMVAAGRTGGPTSFRRAAGYVARRVRTGVTLVGTPIVSIASATVRPITRKPRPLARRYLSEVGLGALLVVLWLLLITIVVEVYIVYSWPILPPVRAQLAQIPLALGDSLGRLALAYAISLVIAFPLAVFLVHHTRAYRVGLPIVEVIASVPATALFPVFIFGLLPYIGFQGASVLMLITGMMWYLFFNILSGVRAIPPDLDEAARSYGLPRWNYYRRVLFPAVVPAFLTGSITAFGGGWNALVVAEYLQTGGRSFRVLGIGELINVGNFAPGNSGTVLMVSSLLALVLAVLVLNELLWKPLYRKAVEKYRYD